MAQYQTPGGGVVDSGEKRIERKVVVSTSGNPTAPGGNGRLTNVTINEEAGGLRRGVFEYTIGGGGDSTYNAYGKKIELTAGSREVPIYNHPYFKTLTPDKIYAVQQAIEDKQSIVFEAVQQKLFDYLVRQVEYILVPNVVARISEIESTIPSTVGLCKVANPPGLNAPKDTFWIWTSVSASPIGDKYEVTREYTSVPQSWDDVNFLYNWWAS